MVRATKRKTRGRIRHIQRRKNATATSGIIRRRGRRYVRLSGLSDIYKPVEIRVKNSIAFFGCWGTGCEEGTGQWYVANSINGDPKIDLMITAGDNFYEKKVGKGDDKQTFFRKNVDLCYRKTMYASLGNHDIEEYNLQREHTTKNKRWVLPAKNYIIHVNKDIRVVMINTNPFYEREAYEKYLQNGETIWRGDMDELNNFIDNLPPSDRLTIIIGHHPFLTNRHKNKGKKHTIDERVRKIIDKADLYICADEHNLQHIVSEEDGLDEFILGGGGGDPDRNIILDYPEKTRYQYGYHGYGVFDVKGKTMEIRYLDSETKEVKDSNYNYLVQKRH